MRIPITIWGAAVLLASCAHQPAPTPEKEEDRAAREAGIVVTPIVRETVKAETHSQSLSSLLSPYSSEGMLLLNQYRTHNPKLDEFLQRNRKPDFFFGGTETGFKFQKIYLVYLKNENLYLFDPALPEPYRKYHPLPPSIRDRVAALRPLLAPAPAVAAAPPPREEASAPPAATTATPARKTDAPQAAERDQESVVYEIEKNLGQKRPGPTVDIPLLFNISRGEAPPDLEQAIYYFDKPLAEMLDNEYSIKYDNRKHSVKVIFPQSYDGSALYADRSLQTRKILVNRDPASGKEWSILVPDFLPGSPFYQGTRGSVSKVFSSLYQIVLPTQVKDASKLRLRYELKLCQRDERQGCSHRSGGSTTVRAIVLGATLYDGHTLVPVETFLLK